MTTNSRGNETWDSLDVTDTASMKWTPTQVGAQLATLMAQADTLVIKSRRSTMGEQVATVRLVGAILDVVTQTKTTDCLTPEAMSYANDATAEQWLRQFTVPGLETTICRCPSCLPSREYHDADLAHRVRTKDYSPTMAKWYEVNGVKRGSSLNPVRLGG